MREKMLLNEEFLRHIRGFMVLKELRLVLARFFVSSFSSLFFFLGKKKRSQCLGRLDFGPAFSLNVEWHFYKRKKKEKKRP